MDNMTMGMGDSSMGGMMVPYLHFTGGDYLLFSVWRPTSQGGIAGACIALLLLAMFERFLAAVRVVFDRHWHKRALAMISIAESQTLGGMEGGKEDVVVASGPHVNKARRGSEDDASPTNSTTAGLPRARTIPPFIAQHDIPRGLLFMFKMFFDYLLMLAIMTFNAAYFISILIGFGIGEILFGRVARLH